jgi:hypothetical protein
MSISGLSVKGEETIIDLKTFCLELREVARCFGRDKDMIERFMQDGTTWSWIVLFIISAPLTKIVTIKGRVHSFTKELKDLGWIVQNLALSIVAGDRERRWGSPKDVQFNFSPEPSYARRIALSITYLEFLDWVNCKGSVDLNQPLEASSDIAIAHTEFETVQAITEVLSVPVEEEYVIYTTQLLEYVKVMYDGLFVKGKTATIEELIKNIDDVAQIYANIRKYHVIQQIVLERFEQAPRAVEADRLRKETWLLIEKAHVDNGVKAWLFDDIHKLRDEYIDALDLYVKYAKGIKGETVLGVKLRGPPTKQLHDAVVRCDEWITKQCKYYSTRFTGSRVSSHISKLVKEVGFDWMIHDQLTVATIVEMLYLKEYVDSHRLSTIIRNSLKISVPINAQLLTLARRSDAPRTGPTFPLHYFIDKNGYYAISDHSHIEGTKIFMSKSVNAPFLLIDVATRSETGKFRRIVFVGDEFYSPVLRVLSDRRFEDRKKKKGSPYYRQVARVFSIGIKMFDNKD